MNQLDPGNMKAQEHDPGDTKEQENQNLYYWGGWTNKICSPTSQENDPGNMKEQENQNLR